MSKNRPFVLSIAGFDPSGGAGVWLIVKHSNSMKSMGWLLIRQTQIRNNFYEIEWTSLEFTTFEKLLIPIKSRLLKLGLFLHYFI
jgi:hydroxymethylpyrimidine/phosphomethylpyrimidine kinase